MHDTCFPYKHISKVMILYSSVKFGLLLKKNLRNIFWGINWSFWATSFLCCRASRHTLPAGVGVVTQFHAWWHIFTGLGSYLHILLRCAYTSNRKIIFFNLCVLLWWEKIHIHIKYPSSFSLQIRATYLKYRPKVKVCLAISSSKLNYIL